MHSWIALALLVGLSLVGTPANAGTIAAGPLRLAPGDGLTCQYTNVGKKRVTIAVTRILGDQRDTSDLIGDPGTTPGAGFTNTTNSSQNGLCIFEGPTAKILATACVLPSGLERCDSVLQAQ